MPINLLFITLSTHTILCVTIHPTRALSDATVINGIAELSIRTGCYIYTSSHMEKINCSLRAHNVLECNKVNTCTHVFTTLTSTVLCKGNTETTSYETQQQTKTLTLHDQSESLLHVNVSCTITYAVNEKRYSFYIRLACHVL